MNNWTNFFFQEHAQSLIFYKNLNRVQRRLKETGQLFFLVECFGSPGDNCLGSKTAALAYSSLDTQRVQKFLLVNFLRSLGSRFFSLHAAKNSVYAKPDNSTGDHHLVFLKI